MSNGKSVFHGIQMYECFNLSILLPLSLTIRPCLTFDSGQFSGLCPALGGGGGCIKGVGADAATIAFRGMWNVGNSVREGDWVGRQTWMET